MASTRSFFSTNSTPTNPDGTNPDGTNPDGTDNPNGDNSGSGDDGSDDSSGWLDSIGSWFSNLLSGILEGLLNLGSSIATGLDTLGNFLLDGITFLFVPSDGFMENEVKELKERFSFADSIMETANSIFGIMSVATVSDSAPSLHFDMNIRGTVKRVEILDLSWYAPYKSYGDSILNGIIILGFIWSTYTRLPNIVSGISSSASTITKIGGGE